MRRFFFCFLFPLLLVAQEADVQHEQKRDPDSQDMEALKRWIQDKRMVTMREIGGDLSISGEVRTEFQATSEVNDGTQQRGRAGLRPMYAWDVEVNLMLDYRTDRTWAAIKLEFDNDMGQLSGTVDAIALEKAYLGGRLIAGDTFTFDGELGRRYLYNVFDSYLEFGSIFDGLLFRLSKAWESVGDTYANIGAFLIDDKTNHYGFVTEIGALRIANVGLNLKYSIIDWYRPGTQSKPTQTSVENALANLRYRFLVSQVLASYQYYPEWLGKRLLKFYGAALTNHLALTNPLQDKVGADGRYYGKQNWGWYAGMSIGVVKKQGDWAIDTNFQWLELQAVPSFDANGIGRGNAGRVGIYTAKEDGSGGVIGTKAAIGNTNYYGFEVESLYAFTDNLTLQQSFKWSWTLDHRVGPNITYKQFETEFIYAF